MTASPTPRKPTIWYMIAPLSSQRLFYTDLSLVENLYTVMAYLMARPQYLAHLHDIAHFRERSDVAMGDFMMRVSQPVAFRVSLTLEASYESHAEEDGVEDWAAAPKNPPDILTYDEVYVKRKLQPPTDPESVIIDRPHSFAPEIPPQLLPHHPLDASASPSLDKTQNAQQLNTIGLRLYTPATCSGAPDLPSSPHASAACKEFHWQLLRATRKAVGIDGIYAFDVKSEAINLEGLEQIPPHKEQQVCHRLSQAEAC
ncbi:hypothetical protein EPH_0000400 [Eimeria praecox]|uniref:Uncharacterized protein n=1 Tax=Eimeria praecox TaxID=51316 RepID=U6G2M7_9EIME|nr:hypothetical protein EPH_0000400 [Eimeria praecox]